MLQQTTVATVAARFDEWMRRFPDIASLARATERQVLRAWEGLGYYSRARNLRRAARVIVDKHGGRIPASYDELTALPGVGDYTARAVLSIAFDRPFSMIDANSRRICMRLHAWRTWSPARARTARAFLDAALPAKNPGRFNEALMELGELVCRPANPRCEECPLARKCEARSRGLQNQIPARRRIRYESNTRRVAVAVSRGRILLERPTDGIRFQGMWLLPELASLDPLRAIRVRLPPVTQSFTRYRIRLEPELVRLAPSQEAGPSRRWVPLAKADDFPMPSVYRRVIASSRPFL